VIGRLLRVPLVGRTMLVLGAIAVSYVLAYGISLAWVSSSERVLDREWERLVGPTRVQGATFTPMTENEPARRADRLCRELGISLKPLKELPEGPPTPWEGVERSFHRYLQDELPRESSKITPVPPEIEAFLEEHRDVIAELRATFCGEEAPRWNVAPGHLVGDDGPHLLGFLFLSKCFLVDALAGELRGDSLSVEMDLEASWRISEHLLSRLELHAQEMAMAIGGFQSGVLRKVTSDHDLWRERLRHARYRTSLLRAWQHEAWIYREAGRYLGRVPFYRKLNRRERILWRTFGRVWRRMAYADISRRYLREMEILNAAGSCRGDYPSVTEDVFDTIPWWNEPAKMSLKNLGAYRARLERLGMDQELTGKVLLIQDLVAGNGGKWPRSIQGIQHSRCPRGRWIYTVNGEEEMRIAYSDPNLYPPRKGVIELSLSYVSGPRPVH